MLQNLLKLLQLGQPLMKWHLEKNGVSSFAAFGMVEWWDRIGLQLIDSFSVINRVLPQTLFSQPGLFLSQSQLICVYANVYLCLDFIPHHRSRCVRYLQLNQAVQRAQFEVPAEAYLQSLKLAYQAAHNHVVNECQSLVLELCTAHNAFNSNIPKLSLRDLKTLVESPTRFIQLLKQWGIKELHSLQRRILRFCRDFFYLAPFLSLGHITRVTSIDEMNCLTNGLS